MSITIVVTRSLYSRPFVKVEDRRVLARVQQETGLDSQVWMVVDSGQYALSPRTDRFFQATTYGPDPDAADQNDDVAIEVTIDPRYPDVKLNPLLRSGRPTVAGRNIHIATLTGMVLDGDPVSKVAGWYDLSEDQVRQAVDFTVTHKSVERFVADRDRQQCGHHPASTEALHLGDVATPGRR